jgi:uncharacterized membrane protein
MTASANRRIGSLDLLKGLVIVIMALDHVRDYFHYDAHFVDASDPNQTYPGLYLTRFITHFCAPIFSLLAGVSACIIGRKKTKAELSAFLLKRGLWLVFVELVIVNFAWHFNPRFTDFGFMVIWVLGVSMICLAGLIHLPSKVMLAFSLVLIFGHNLLDNFHYNNSFFWSLLHERNKFVISPDLQLRTSYTIIPWAGVMSLGYWFGQFYAPEFDPARRRRILNIVGLASLLLFIVLRLPNLYGDPVEWTAQDTLLKSLYSFFNITKYPVSLQYLLVTLGIAFLVLANSEHWKGRVVEFFTVFGRVPFFFYILHLYLIHAMAMVAAQLTGFGWESMVLDTLPFWDDKLKGYGFSLWVVYGVWFVVIALLYPLCKRFDRYKASHKDQWWLSYF